MSDIILAVLLVINSALIITVIINFGKIKLYIAMQDRGEDNEKGILTNNVEKKQSKNGNEKIGEAQRLREEGYRNILDYSMRHRRKTE